MTHPKIKKNMTNKQIQFSNNNIDRYIVKKKTKLQNINIKY